MQFVLSWVLLEVQHYTGELILLSFEDSRTYLHPFDAVYIQVGYNRLVAGAHNTERLTSILRLCNGVFTSRSIFR